MRDYMNRRRQDGRNNMYSYERMLQRQNEARMNQERRMFKREAEGSFEYDVMAEHSADNTRRLIAARPQQTYTMNQMDDRMDIDHQQYNMDNRMNNKMNRFDSHMNQ